MLVNDMFTNIDPDKSVLIMDIDSAYHYNEILKILTSPNKTNLSKLYYAHDGIHGRVIQNLGIFKPDKLEVKVDPAGTHVHGAFFHNEWSDLDYDGTWATRCAMYDMLLVDMKGNILYDRATAHRFGDIPDEDPLSRVICEEMAEIVNNFHTGGSGIVTSVDEIVF